MNVDSSLFSRDESVLVVVSDTFSVLLNVLLKIFFPFIFISWRLITLQYCSGFVVLPHTDMNQPWIYMCSPS